MRQAWLPSPTRVLLLATTSSLPCYTTGAPDVPCLAVASATNTWEDTTPPDAQCILGPNPNGRLNPDWNAGFREVIATDNAGVVLLVITDGVFTSDELNSGDYVQLTVSPGSAGSDVRPGPGVLTTHITTAGQPMLVASDAAGNSTSVPCGPLPPVS